MISQNQLHFSFCCTCWGVGQTTHGQVREDKGKAKHEDFPDQVAIYVRDEYNAPLCRVGTGTLISNQWILTSTHLFKPKNNDKVSWGRVTDVYVQFGETECFGVTEQYLREVAERKAYHKRNSLDRTDTDFLPHEDITLLNLENPIEGFTGFARLPPQDYNIEDYKDMEFAGFGRNKEGESGTLRKGTTKKLPLKYFKLDDEHAVRKGSQLNDF